MSQNKSHTTGHTSKQADTAPQVEDTKVEAKPQEPVQAAGKQQAQPQQDVKPAQQAAAPKANQIQTRQGGQQQFDQGEQQQGGLGSINLSEILPDFSSEDIAGFGEKITAYAEEKPLQTMGFAVAGGALVGWLLISKQGQSLLRTTASIAAPFVGNLIANRQGAKAENVEAPLKH